MILLAEAIDVGFKRYLHREEKLRDSKDAERAKNLSFEGSLFRHNGVCFVSFHISLLRGKTIIQKRKDLNMKTVISLREMQSVVENTVDDLISDVIYEAE